MSREEKQERAEEKQAADAKFKETMEAVKEFSAAREIDKENEPPSPQPSGSK